MLKSNKGFVKENIFIRKLNTEELLSVYTTHSIRHFPTDELKPVSSVERMSREGVYTGYGLFEKEKGDSAGHSPMLLSYAFFTILPDRKNILLDYFAVMEDYRSHGIGSLFLEFVKSSVTDYSGVLIESENPDYARDDSELAIRNLRLDFYKRNGALFTGILAEIFGVQYRLLYFPLLEEKQPVEILYSDFDKIYRHMVSDKNYKNCIRIHMPVSTTSPVRN